MTRTRRTRLTGALVATALAAALAPAGASAGSYTLRPAATASGSGTWNVAPAGLAEWEVLDDAVSQPQAPSTSGDYLHQSSNGPRTVQLSLANAQVGLGETVAGTTAWAYLASGDGRTVTLTLRTAAATLATQTFPAGTAAGWKSLGAVSGLTQAQLDDLRIELTLGGNGASTTSFVYAAYAHVATVDPVVDPPADPPTGDPPADPPVDPVVDPPVDPVVPPVDPPVDPVVPPVDPPIDVNPIVQPALAIAGTTATMTPGGVISIQVGCGLDSGGGCEGRIWLEDPLAAGGQQLQAARRSSKRFSKAKKYKLSPGQKKTVPVRLDRRTVRKFKRKKSFKVAVVAEQKDGNGTVVTLRRTIRVFPKGKKKR